MDGRINKVSKGIMNQRVSIAVFCGFLLITIVIMGLRTGKAKNTLSGDVFVTTRGAGAYKLTSIKVIVIPSATVEEVLKGIEDVNAYFKDVDNLSSFRTKVGSSRKKTYSTVTNSDGKFNLSLPSPGEYLIIADAQRFVVGKQEEYGWLLLHEMEKGKDSEISLNNANMVVSINKEGKTTVDWNVAADFLVWAKNKQKR